MPENTVSVHWVNVSPLMIIKISGPISHLHILVVSRRNTQRKLTLRGSWGDGCYLHFPLICLGLSSRLFIHNSSSSNNNNNIIIIINIHDCFSLTMGLVTILPGGFIFVNWGEGHMHSHTTLQNVFVACALRCVLCVREEMALRPCTAGPAIGCVSVGWGVPCCPSLYTMAPILCALGTLSRCTGKSATTWLLRA